MRRTLFFVLLCTALAKTQVFAQSPYSFSEPELFSHCGGFLEAPAFDDEGNLWLLDIPADRILKVTPDGNCAVIGSSDSIPNGLQFNSDGEIILAGSRGILAYDPLQNESKVLLDAYEGMPINSANDLVFDSSGGLYFTVTEDSDAFTLTGKVFYLPPGEDAASLVLSGVAFPNGISITPDGASVIISEFASKRLISIPSQIALSSGARTTRIVLAYTSGGIGPDGMTHDESGRLYVANLGSRGVQVFDPLGRLLTELQLPEEAGILTSNVVIKQNYLYITEGEKGDSWRARSNDQYSAQSMDTEEVLL